jgi:hypothetical protein
LVTAINVEKITCLLAEIEIEKIFIELIDKNAHEAAYWQI